MSSPLDALIDAVAEAVAQKLSAREQVQLSSEVLTAAAKHDEPQTRNWLNVDQVAAYSGFGKTFVLEALQTGGLRGYQLKAGSPWRVHPRDVDAWIRGEPAPPVEVPRVTRRAS